MLVKSTMEQKKINIRFNPVSAISRIVCLIAQMILSMNNLN